MTLLRVDAYVEEANLRAAHQLDDPPAADALAGLSQPPLTPDGPRRGRRAVHEVGRQRLRAVHRAPKWNQYRIATI